MRKRLTQRLAEFFPYEKKAKGELKREITDDFKYNPKKLKHLKHILHSVNVSLGTLISALNEFSRIKGPDISPDGMIGGRGYIMTIRDIKEGLNTSVKTLTDVADSIADELTNPKWEAQNDKEVKELIEEKEKNEDKVEEVEEEIQPEDIKNSAEVEKLSDLIEDISPDEDKVIGKKASEKKVSSEDILAQEVQKTLVMFNSIGIKN